MMTHFFPCPTTTSNVLTFGGDPSPLDDGIYFVNGRVILARSSDVSEHQPVVQVFANDIRNGFMLSPLLSFLTS